MPLDRKTKANSQVTGSHGNMWNEICDLRMGKISDLEVNIQNLRKFEYDWIIVLPKK